MPAVPAGTYEGSHRSETDPISPELPSPLNSIAYLLTSHTVHTAHDATLGLLDEREEGADLGDIG